MVLEKIIGKSVYYAVFNTYPLNLVFWVSIARALVDDMFTAPIKRIWKKIEKIILEERKETNEPEILEWFEYLYNGMRKREQKLQQEGARNG